MKMKLMSIKSHCAQIVRDNHLLVINNKVLDQFLLFNSVLPVSLL